MPVKTFTKMWLSSFPVLPEGLSERKMALPINVFWLKVHFVSVGECCNNKHLTMQPSLQQSALINTSNSNYVLFKWRTNNRRCQCVVWHFLISLWIFMRWSNNACYSSLCCLCVCLLCCCLSASIHFQLSVSEGLSLVPLPRGSCFNLKTCYYCSY